MTQKSFPLAFVLPLFLAACSGGLGNDDPDAYEFEYCEEGQIRTALCSDGLCDPAPFVECDEGNGIECADSLPGCGYHLSQYCEDDEIISEYCSTFDTSCWSNDEYDVCDDGSCRNAGEVCPYEMLYCDDNGRVASATCDSGLCDPQPFEECGDGTCVHGTEACGYIYQFCEDNVVQNASCTSGLCDPAAFQICDDESCVLDPEECPA